MNVLAKTIWVMSTWVLGMVVSVATLVSYMITGEPVPAGLIWFTWGCVFIVCCLTVLRLNKVAAGIELYKIAGPCCDRPKENA